MYESLTAYLPRLQNIEYGKWIIDKENDGTPEHPIRAPFVAYSKEVDEFVDSIYSFVESHEEMGLRQYFSILEAAGILTEIGKMKDPDVSVLDGRTVMALLVLTVRAERFCDGALLNRLEEGLITRCLLRLKEIDEGK